MGAILLTWVNFKPGMDRQLHAQESVGEITYPPSNFNGCTVEVWEIKSNSIPHVIMDAITYLS